MKGAGRRVGVSALSHKAIGNLLVEIVPRELVGPERLLPQLGHGGAALSGVEVREVTGRQTALGRLEHQGKGHSASQATYGSGTKAVRHRRRREA